MDTLTIYLTALAFILAYMSTLWLLSLVIRNASIVDICWGLGFVLTCALYFVLSDGYAPRKVLLTALVAIWGLRLTLHIARRNLGHGEDQRYQAWRRQHGARWWWVSFFQVFLLQGVVMWLVSAPLLAAQTSRAPDSLTPLDGVGALLWAVGFGFEAISDWQLMRFKQDARNKGKVMARGLWRYSRHPNYFGEAMLWWGFFAIALATPNGWLTVLSPLLMTFLLLRVSGVTLTEQTMAQRPGYREYVARTSAFVPLPPRQS